MISLQLNLICGSSTLTRPARGSSGFSKLFSGCGLGGIRSSGGIYCFTTELILPPANPL